jgi:protein O-GlcNAc transferase
MKKIISFSLWGTNPIYTVGAIENAILAKKHYPGWICRYYLADSVKKDIINLLSIMDNVEIIQMGPGKTIDPTFNGPSADRTWDAAMYWRFYPASESDCEVMISRDTDSRLNSREAAAVKEWLESGKAFHIMRDHPAHGTEILGGMWGVKCNVLANMKDMIHKSDLEVDQNFLRNEIYPLVKNDCCVHDEFFEKKPFPTKRKPGLFIGQAFDENNNKLYPEHGDQV